MKDKAVHAELLEALQIFGDKWSVMILFCLMEKPLSFSEVQEKSGGVNPRTLAKKLKDLNKAGLIDKKLIKEFPPRSEYSLTKKALDLKEATSELKAWAKKYCKGC